MERKEGRKEAERLKGSNKRRMIKDTIDAMVTIEECGISTL